MKTFILNVLKWILGTAIITWVVPVAFLLHLDSWENIKYQSKETVRAYKDLYTYSRDLKHFI
jgi:hypothetical protein